MRKKSFKDSDVESEGSQSRGKIEEETKVTRKRPAVNFKKVYDSDKDERSLNRTLSSDGGYFNADSDSLSDDENDDGEADETVR